MDALTNEHPLWTPGPERVAAAHLTQFMREVRAAHPGQPIGHDYASQWQWSVENPEAFWVAAWRYCSVVAETHNDG
ncbi:MAG: hypothetical protein H0X64_08650, partial [Gemmatimonadaceae bacterium]|nr:hypothetical protein [Gemmatimonadaceae bacterium]